MGILVVTEFLTLDGVGQGPGAPDEDPDGGFTHGGWQAPMLEEGAEHTLFAKAATMDALLLGRKTYDIFAAYWPNASDETPFTELLNRVPKYVASRTLAEPLSWAGSTLVAGDLPDGVEAIKQRHDEVHVIGSLNLVQSLLRFALVDKLELWVYPLLLGSGKRPFGDRIAPSALRLTEWVAHPNGTLQLTYEPVGPPSYGTIGAEE